jgi:undecaprenyl-diphosphatase
MRYIRRLDTKASALLRIAEQPGPARSFAAFLAHSGDSWFWGAALVIIWLLGDHFWKEWSLFVLAAISVLAALVMTLKFMIRRRRPEGEWGGIYRNTDPHSFPSGHAARAFLIAVLGTYLGPAGLAIALWLWAPLVALARVAMGVHYVSDVIAGSIVGVVFGFVAWRAHEPFLIWLQSLGGLLLG